MNIKDVFRLEPGTIVQNIETKDRYIVYIFGSNKYLIKYKNRSKCKFISSFAPWEEISKIVCIPTNEMILAEYQILSDFKERENFIYTDKNGNCYRGIILSVEDFTYDVVVAKEDILGYFTIYQKDMWRMKKIK